MQSEVVRIRGGFWIWAVIAWGAGAIVFFREFVLSGFDKVFGDLADGRLQAYLHEHLYLGLKGLAPFTSPPIFHPQKGVLGYSEAFVLDLLIYGPLRLLGLGPYLSFQLTWLVLSLIGFISFAAILVRFAGVRIPVALVGAALFVFSNMLMLATAGAHPNLLAVYWVPVFVLLFLEGLRGIDRGSMGSLAAMFLAWMVNALIFSTDYYVAWCLNFLGMLAIIVSVAARPHTMRTLAGRYSRGSVLRLFWAGICGFAIGLIPFIAIYIPALLQFGGYARSISEYLLFAPTIPEVLINVGEKNMIWGSLLKATHIISPSRMSPSEFTFAVTPFLLVSAVVSALAAGRRRILAGSGDTAARAAVLASVAAALLLALITAQFGGRSAFEIVFAIVPGASAIRAGGRFGVVGSGVLAAAAAIGFDRGLRSVSFPWRALIYAVMAMCLLEQLNFAPMPNISRHDESRWLASVPPPPEACRCFFIARQANRPTVFQQLDAMMISQKIGIPTINGCTGKSPPGWFLEEMMNPSYSLLARQWADLHGITEGLFEYDVARQQWLAVPVDHAWPSQLQQPMASVFRLGPEDRCLGTVDAVEWMPSAAGSALWIFGWAVDKRFDRRVHAIVAAVNGKIAGLCAVGFERPDIVSGLHIPGAGNSGWEGYVRAPDPISRVDILAIFDDNLEEVCPLASVTVPKEFSPIRRWVMPLLALAVICIMGPFLVLRTKRKAREP